MAVIAPKGIVGRVVGRPAAHAARVQLIIDRHAAAGALIERTRAGGMIVGGRQGAAAALELVSNLADVKVGRHRRHLRGRRHLPEGLCDRPGRDVGAGTAGCTWTITVRPAVDFRSLEEVLVVLVPAQRGGHATGRRRSAAGGARMKAAVVIAGAGRWRWRCRRRSRALAGWRAPPSTWCWSPWSTSRWRSGRLPGCWPARAGGLIQDALAGGIIGIGGLAKTLVGFVVGVLGAQFIVSQPLPRFVMFVGATVVHELCFQALYALVESRGVPVPGIGDADPGRRQRAGRHPGVPDRREGPRPDAAARRAAPASVRSEDVTRSTSESRMPLDAA